MATSLEQPNSDQLVGVVINPASITPPQSANGKKDVPEGVPSELSDLELDAKSASAQDEIPIKMEEKEEPILVEEEIEPDHYYGGGKIPVFKPVSELSIYLDFDPLDRPATSFSIPGGAIILS
ncbi:Jumonji family transcription factor [Penicillium herquei]|nr:Jumonji family transcription factor [Penicillium herquei]